MGKISEQLDMCLFLRKARELRNSVVHEITTTKTTDFPLIFHPKLTFNHYTLFSLLS